MIHIQYILIKHILLNIENLYTHNRKLACAFNCYVSIVYRFEKRLKFQFVFGNHDRWLYTAWPVSVKLVT